MVAFKAMSYRWEPIFLAFSNLVEKAAKISGAGHFHDDDFYPRPLTFTFTRFPKSQWKSIRTSNAIERLHEEFKRRIKTQTVLPSAETAAMLFWALLASGQITMRKVDGWRSLAEKPSDQIIDLAA